MTGEKEKEVLAELRRFMIKEIRLAVIKTEKGMAKGQYDSIADYSAKAIAFLAWFRYMRIQPVAQIEPLAPMIASAIDSGMDYDEVRSKFMNRLKDETPEKEGP